MYVELYGPSTTTSLRTLPQSIPTPQATTDSHTRGQHDRREPEPLQRGQYDKREPEPLQRGQHDRREPEPLQRGQHDRRELEPLQRG